MNILFLDVDGVLNSTRSCVAVGGYPHGFDSAQRGMFDEIAVMLIQRLCRAADVQVVVSSAWRLHHDYTAIGVGLGLPTIGRTPSLPGVRGNEIKAWLAEHPEVDRYAIVDDDPDMLPEQLPYFVQTDGREGLRWADFVKLCGVFGLNGFDVATPNRLRSANPAKLDWEAA